MLLQMINHMCLPACCTAHVRVGHKACMSPQDCKPCSTVSRCTHQFYKVAKGGERQNSHMSCIQSANLAGGHGDRDAWDTLMSRAEREAGLQLSEMGIAGGDGNLVAQ
jgi:hypothetical protein